MTFFQALQGKFTLVQQLELMLRIAVAAVCGGIIGVERSRRFKDAGVRTHAMVAGAAATLMIISKYGFADLTDAAGMNFPGTRGADPARIAAQIVSGVSFLGVGVIYRDRRLATRGLTTAAGIWAVAGVGMAIGSGMYGIGLFSMLFMLVLQYLTHRLPLGQDRYITSRLEMTLQDDPALLDALLTRLREQHIQILESEMRRLEGGLMTCKMQIRAETSGNLDALSRTLIADARVRSVRLGEED